MKKNIKDIGDIVEYLDCRSVVDTLEQKCLPSQAALQTKCSSGTSIRSIAKDVKPQKLQKNLLAQNIEKK